MNRGEQAAAVVMGSVLIGIWLGWTMLEDTSWLIWGAFGFLLAAGLYGAKLGNPIVRLSLWSACGIGLGLLITFAILETSANFLATVFTFGGGALITSALPAPSKESWTAVEAES